MIAALWVALGVLAISNLALWLTLHHHSCDLDTLANHHSDIFDTDD